MHTVFFIVAIVCNTCTAIPFEGYAFESRSACNEEARQAERQLRRDGHRVALKCERRYARK